MLLRASGSCQPGVPGRRFSTTTGGRGGRCGFRRASEAPASEASSAQDDAARASAVATCRRRVRKPSTLASDWAAFAHQREATRLRAVHTASETDTQAPAGTEAAIEAQLDRRRRAVAERWNLDGEIVLVGAGSPVPVPGRGDRTYPFRSHSEYLYLTDRERPGGALVFDPAEGWVDFVTPVSREERL